MGGAISEAGWEQLVLEDLSKLGWRVLSGTDIAPGAQGGRDDWADIVLRSRSIDALRRINPEVPTEYLVEALAAVCTPTSQDPLVENRRLHDVLVNGYRGVTYLDPDGVERTPTIRFLAPDTEDNDFLAVNQVMLKTREHERRFDVVLYVNGFPVVVIELKRAGSEAADVAAAQAQLGTYLREFPMAFRFAVLTVVSDGISARYGTPWTPLNHYAPWNVDTDGKPLRVPEDEGGWAPIQPELAPLVDGLFERERFLELQRDFVAFDRGASGIGKRIAKPHQYYAVKKAIASTVHAVESHGKAGVVWHTQGSGKSFEMELYAHAVGRQPKLKNPTVVVVTDRTELDTQLFDSFDRSLLLGEKPVNVTSRQELRAALSTRVTGGIYFTTLQKFSLGKDEREAGLDHPLLSDRRNIVVVVDEAHRSHYDDLDGYARHIRDALPKAAFIAFTGTPINTTERNTRAVFGPVIDVYDLTRAVEDGATVPVRFEPRIITVQRDAAITEAELDAAADEAATGLDDVERERVEKAVTVINAVYGAPEVIAELARDVLDHWDKRSAAMRPFVAGPGKAMIVCPTREICAKLYDEIVERRPEWHSDAVDEGVVKVVYSGNASDTGLVARHVRRAAQTKVIQQRVRTADDPLQLVVVQNMMLTGFDAPPLHTMYLDRPLRGAALMQALARVNRTFRGKPEGLLVAYAPVAENLQAALAEYSEDDRANKPVGRDVEEAASLTRELIAQIDEVCAGYPWRAQLDGSPRSMRDAAIGLTNYLRSPATPDIQVGDGSEPVGARFRKLASRLARAWALSTGSTGIDDLRKAARFYEEVRAWMAEFDALERQAAGRPVPEETERLLAGIVATATDAGEVVDIYEAAGMPKPLLSDLSPDFIRATLEARNPHLAIEALRDLLLAETTRATRGNRTRRTAFSVKLAELMNRYTNAQLTSAEVIAELIAFAREVAEEGSRGARFTPPLTADELAFYDTVATNDSAVQLQGEDVLAQIARELVAVMQRDVKTDWAVRDEVRAKLRSSIKRLLVKYDYPPDKQPEAINRVLSQIDELAPLMVR